MKKINLSTTRHKILAIIIAMVIFTISIISSVTAYAAASTIWVEDSTAKYFLTPNPGVGRYTPDFKYTIPLSKLTDEKRELFLDLFARSIGSAAPEYDFIVYFDTTYYMSFFFAPVGTFIFSDSSSTVSGSSYKHVLASSTEEWYFFELTGFGNTVSFSESLTMPANSTGREVGISKTTSACWMLPAVANSVTCTNSASCRRLYDVSSINFKADVPLIEYHPLIIQYIYEDGSTAAPSVSKNYATGTGYSIPSPTVEGFVPDIEVVSGTMAAGGTTVTVTYTEEAASGDSSKDNKNLDVVGIVQPISTVDVDVPLNLSFVIDSARNITYTQNAKIVNHSPAPLVVTSKSVVPQGEAPALVADNTFVDWDSLTADQTSKNIALSINSQNISNADVELGYLASAFTSDTELPLNLSVLYGKTWLNTEALHFQYVMTLGISLKTT